MNTPLLSLGLEGLMSWVEARNWPRFHARQVWRWVFVRRCRDFSQMTDVPKRLREELADHLDFFSTRVVREQRAKDGTCKLLLELRDKETIECVLIPEQERRTACISTQVGCGMGCVFCASGLNGLARNLDWWEILEQLLHLSERLAPAERLTHLVVMGMGEPLANLDNLLLALRWATDQQGLGLSQRHVTISTVGLPAKIRQLADLQLSYHLAVSLHAPNDELRNRIVPINARIGIAAILEAADYFFQKTGRQVTYEYVLLRGINDGAEQARQLGQLLRGRRAHVNLIPFNDVPGLPYRRPSDAALAEFMTILRHHGVSVTVRKRKGSEIEAACGQLRRQMRNQAKEFSVATEPIVVPASMV
ncbi:MAG: 23S rRNA (adenine(2503)-C(2))-methyltransferase RlmN [Gemmatales bacterium]|nr:23S rRNA (adenine(2503)-C(2))-methyltransferase RlmN [Gemmatales bacterium]MDW7994012.1 23S rRNA (adenine(2503)-C(2))-methyltransferase RlmN [Gemmatales bacterium]